MLYASLIHLQSHAVPFTRHDPRFLLVYLSVCMCDIVLDLDQITWLEFFYGSAGLVRL